uniref:Uncharacterized protein n=1 Tax=Oryza meridionalis TaxID=40149 RepID=A0A0E0C9Z3_9ORYZ
MAYMRRRWTGCRWRRCRRCPAPPQGRPVRRLPRPYLQHRGSDDDEWIQRGKGNGGSATTRRSGGGSGRWSSSCGRRIQRQPSGCGGPIRRRRRCTEGVREVASVLREPRGRGKVWHRRGGREAPPAPARRK